MIGRMLIATAALVTMLVTLGCGRSPQVTFYTLLPAAASEAPAAVGSVPAIAVGPVTLPEVVDRPQLVVRSGGNQVAVLESQRWAEPLKDGIPRYLAQELGRMLGSYRVSSYDHFTGAPADYRVVLDFSRFESAGDLVTVEANWVVRRHAGGTLPELGHSLVREKTRGSGYDQVVAAYGRALTKLSGDLAKAVRVEAAKPAASRGE